MRPVRGRSRPATARSSDVLPAPEGPIRRDRLGTDGQRGAKLERPPGKDDVDVEESMSASAALKPAGSPRSRLSAGRRSRSPDRGWRRTGSRPPAGESGCCPGSCRRTGSSRRTRRRRGRRPLPLPPRGRHRPAEPPRAASDAAGRPQASPRHRAESGRRLRMPRSLRASRRGWPRTGSAMTTAAWVKARSMPERVQRVPSSPKRPNATSSASPATAGGMHERDLHQSDDDAAAGEAVPADDVGKRRARAQS